MILNPSPDYRYALKHGMHGTDVAALQINFPVLAVDGVYGDKTEEVIKDFQASQSLDPIDGIAGLDTQKKLCVKRSARASLDNALPVGLLKSIMSNESGFAIAAFSSHPSDSGFDLGAYQDSITPIEVGSQTAYRAAYNIAIQASAAAKKIKARRDIYLSAVDSRYKTDLAGGNNTKFSWQLAVLYHNWEYAADKISQRGHIYNDPTEDDEPKDWIIEVSRDRLQTSREWVTSYITRATVYVNW